MPPQGWSLVSCWRSTNPARYQDERHRPSRPRPAPVRLPPGGGLERAHAECLGQGQGPSPACFLPLGEVEGLVGILPSLIAVSRQTTSLAEPCGPEGMILPTVDTEILRDPLFQQRASLREAPLEGIRRAQAGHDRREPVPGAGGTTEGQALLRRPDGGLQVPPGEVQETQTARGQRSVIARGRRGWRGGAPPPRGASPRRKPRARSGSASTTPGLDPHARPGRARLPVRRRHAPPQ